MSIAPKEFLTYINGALDGMVQIVEALGDERVNLRPNNMPNTNSPFTMLTHCVGLTRYFIGTALAGRQVHRDRDAEFRAQGTVAEIRQAVRELQQHLSDDLARVRGDQPCAFPEAVREPHRTWTQGRFVLHILAAAKTKVLEMGTKMSVSVVDERIRDWREAWQYPPCSPIAGNSPNRSRLSHARPALI